MVGRLFVTVTATTTTEVPMAKTINYSRIQLHYYP